MLANHYSGMPLMRDDSLRRDDAAVARLRADPRSRVLALWRGRHQVEGGDAPAPVWHCGADGRRLLEEAECWALLGTARDGAASFAVDLSHLDSPAEAAPLRAAEFIDLRAVGPLVGRADGAVMAYARGLMYWQRRCRFCGLCGGACIVAQAGHVRRCANPECAADHFPRTDPAVIVLVTFGDRCLLGRQKHWRPGMRSTLAGFVEPGESLEEAVVREVREESGAVLRDPIYRSSQPWPFPASLMLGFRAEAESLALDVDRRELDDAGWYARDWLRASPEDDGFRLPRRDSIARRLIDDWLAEGDGESGRESPIRQSVSETSA